MRNNVARKAKGIICQPDLVLSTDLSVMPSSVTGGGEQTKSFVLSANLTERKRKDEYFCKIS